MAEVKWRLSAIVERARKERPIVITRNGKPVAVLVVPLDDDDLESLVLWRSPGLREVLESSRKSVREGKALSSEEFRAAVEAADVPNRDPG